ncbi:Uncharacterised protein [Mycobacteroides abscessus subsp. abscessus]|nr:Uncharacterised protein [Mycobacteroides abscessus subsp. abscessus]
MDVGVLPLISFCLRLNRHRYVSGLWQPFAIAIIGRAFVRIRRVGQFFPKLQPLTRHCLGTLCSFGRHLLQQSRCPRFDRIEAEFVLLGIGIGRYTSSLPKLRNRILQPQSTERIINPHTRISHIRRHLNRTRITISRLTHRRRLNHLRDVPRITAQHSPAGTGIPGITLGIGIRRYTSSLPKLRNRILQPQSTERIINPHTRISHIRRHLNRTRITISRLTHRRRLNLRRRLNHLRDVPRITAQHSPAGTGIPGITLGIGIRRYTSSLPKLRNRILQPQST